MKQNSDHSDYQLTNFMSLTQYLGQDALKNNSSLFEAFMENSPAEAWIADADCRMYYINKAYRDTFNVGDELLLKRPEMFPVEYLQRYEENNRKVIAENKPLLTIEDGYDQNGVYKVFKVCKFPLGVHQGRALIGAWMIDLSSELKTEKELQQTNERYLYASRATSDIIWEWFLQDDSVFMAEGYETVFGYTEPFHLHDLQSHTHPADLAVVQSSFDEFLKSGNKCWQMEFRMICKNGDIKHVLNNAFAVRNEEGTVVRIIGALQDRTDIKLLQAKLVKEQVNKKKKLIPAVIEAQEKERNEIGKELHDNVNQLLTSVKLMLAASKNNQQNGDALLDQCEQMIAQALQENRSLSHRLISPSLEAEDFAEAIQMLADTLNLTGNIKVSVQLPALSMIESINTRLRLSIYRIIQEQMGNIVKHANAKKVQIILLKKNDAWNLTISDDGIGFDTSKKSKGIGLKNIYSRVEVHNGATRIKSSPGNGCKFQIKFPEGPQE